MTDDGQGRLARATGEGNSAGQRLTSEDEGHGPGQWARVTGDGRGRRVTGDERGRQRWVRVTVTGKGRRVTGDK